MRNNKFTIYFSTYDDIKNPHYGGGGAIAVHEVAKRLAKKYQVNVLSWDYSGLKKEIIDGVQYERFGFSSVNPKIAMFLYQLWLHVIAMKKEYDVWFESFCPPFTTAFLPLYTRKSVVGIVHMLAAEDMERKYKLPFHLMQNAGLKLYKNVIVTSETLRKKVKSINPSSSITLISNGIQSVKKPVQKKQKYFLYLGRIEVDQKGIDLLILAFKLFHSQNNEYALVIAGSGDEKETENMKKLIADAGLKKSVTLKGKVAGTTKDTLIQDCAGVIIPSRFETYSLVALESMANGAPLICFAIEGLQWIPSKAVLRVPCFDTKKVAHAMKKIISNKPFAATMMQEGNAYAKHFTWDIIAKSYEAYIEHVKNN